MNARNRKALGLTAAALAASSSTLALGGVASATTPKPAPVDLTVVGSNTTQEVMGAYTNIFNASSTASKGNITATNVYAQPADPGTSAPSDANCNGGVAITYISEANPGPNQRTAPNGSSAGKAALAASVSNGDSCVSVARSSSPGSASDPSGTQAYAYAVDSVTWVGQSGGDAPANLSMTSLQDIYNCTYTNWDQVPGDSNNAPIELFYPQEGSGSGSFFAGVLGFDPRNNPSSCPVTQVEENEATEVVAEANNAADAIMIYSGGAWAAQANGVDVDNRDSFVLGTINGEAPYDVETSGKWGPNTKIVTEANVEPSSYNVGNNSVVQGVRNLFNFINTNSVDYTAANEFVGSSSPLCHGKEATTVSKYGFNPLKACVEQS